MPAAQHMIGHAGIATFNTAGQQNLFSLEMEPRISGWARAVVCLRRVSDGASKSIVIDGSIERGEGDVHVHSVQTTEFGSTADRNSLSNCHATLEGVGTTVRVTVECLTNTEIDWTTVMTGHVTQHVDA